MNSPRPSTQLSEMWVRLSPKGGSGRTAEIATAGSDDAVLRLCIFRSSAGARQLTQCDGLWRRNGRNAECPAQSRAPHDPIKGADESAYCALRTSPRVVCKAGTD